MFRHGRFRSRRLPAVVEDESETPREVPSFTHKTLHLGVVHPGVYLPWCTYSTGERSHEPVWVVDTNTSRVELRKTEPAKAEQVDDDDAESEEARDTYGSIGGGMGGGAQPKLSDGSDDDPNEFILKMKKDLELQRQMLRLLAMAHKKAKVEWVQTPFKLTGLEGRGEAEILKLLFLVADQPLDDERITAEQVEELKGQTPYGEFPMISKCGLTFGDASAISMAVATKFQLFGETVQEQMVVGATYSRLKRVQEKHRRTLAWVFCGQVKDKAKIEWAQGQLLHVILPPSIKEWDQQIRSTKGPFLVESGMTLADVAIMDFLDQCSSHVMIDHLLADHLAVADLTEAIRSCPRLLAHLQDREED